MAQFKFDYSTVDGTPNGQIDFTKPITVTDANGQVHVLQEQSAAPPPPPPPSTGVLWKGDAETGDLTQWCNIARAQTDRIKVVTSPVSQGRYAYRFELQEGDVVSGSERAQLDSGISGGEGCHYISDGDEGFYGISIFLPTSLIKSTAWRQVMQFKGMHTGSPPVQIAFTNDEWRLYHRPNTSSSNILKWSKLAQRDVWEKFMFHIKWSKDPTVGFIEMYYNGSLVVPRFNTSNIHVKDGVARQNVVDIGIYRDSGINGTDVVFIDNFTAGNSYQAVAQ